MSLYLSISLSLHSFVFILLFVWMASDITPKKVLFCFNFRTGLGSTEVRACICWSPLANSNQYPSVLFFPFPFSFLSLFFPFSFRFFQTKNKWLIRFIQCVGCFYSLHRPGLVGMCQSVLWCSSYSSNAIYFMELRIDNFYP